MEDESGASFMLSDMLADSAPQPEEICIAKDTLLSVRRFMKQLKNEEERIILHMALRHRSQMEIARAVGCTQSAVSRRLNRIRTELRKAVCAP